MSGAEVRLAAERITPGSAWKWWLSAASATCTASASTASSWFRCLASDGIACDGGGTTLFEGALLCEDAPPLCASSRSAAHRVGTSAAAWRAGAALARSGGVELAAGARSTRGGGRCFAAGGKAAVCATAVGGALSRLYTRRQERSSATPRHARRHENIAKLERGRNGTNLATWAFEE
eukprot:scaffold105513_cov56-Phaeocystis_antarctica.AAC.1